MKNRYKTREERGEIMIDKRIENDIINFKGLLDVY